MTYKVLRDLGSDDTCYHREIKKDTILYGCEQHTYGCISPNGVAVTFQPDGDYPFFEIKKTDVQVLS